MQDTGRDADVMVRAAGAADMAALAALRREWAHEQSGEVADPGFQARFAAWFAAEAPRRQHWLAEAGGRPVGLVGLALFERMPRPGRPASRWGYLSNAFVLAAYRNRRVGRRLVTALLAYATAHDLSRVVLSPAERAVPLYRRFGFGPADMLLALPLDQRSARMAG